MLWPVANVTSLRVVYDVEVRAREALAAKGAISVATPQAVGDAQGEAPGIDQDHSIRLYRSRHVRHLAGDAADRGIGPQSIHHPQHGKGADVDRTGETFRGHARSADTEERDLITKARTQGRGHLRSQNVA